MTPCRCPTSSCGSRPPGAAFPATAGCSPGSIGRANVGLGLGVLSDRRAGARAAQHFDTFLEHLWRLGVLDARLTPSSVREPPRRMAQTGHGRHHTRPRPGAPRGRRRRPGQPAPGRGHLPGHAKRPGRGRGRARRAGGSSDAIPRLPRRRRSPHTSRSRLRRMRRLLPRPRATAALGRLLTAPGVGRVVAGGWSIFWNDLLEGAAPGPARSLASTAARVGRAATAPSSHPSMVHPRARRIARRHQQLSRRSVSVADRGRRCGRARATCSKATDSGLRARSSQEQTLGRLAISGAMLCGLWVPRRVWARG